MASTLGVKPSFDTTDFKTGVDQMNASLRILDSAFKADAAALGDWSKSATGLETRAKSLGQSIDIQRQKVAAIAAEHKRLADAQGADSTAAQNMEVKLNQATAALNGMERELGDTTSKLDALKNAETGTAQGADQAAQGVKKVGDAAQKSGSQSNTFKGILGGLGTALKAVGAAALAAIGAVVAIGGAVAGLALTTIGPASDLNETVSKVGVVFGEAAPQVVAFGEQAATSLGMSENAALSAAGTYGNLFRSMGIDSQASADMSMNLVKLAGDLASFNNIPTDQALEKLRAGLTGEAEPLKSLSINMNAAALEAKALSMGLGQTTIDLTAVKAAQLNVQLAMEKAAAANKKYGAGSLEAQQAAMKLTQAEEKRDEVMRGGKTTLDAAAKAQAAYAIMMEQTALAQGDFSRTSGGLANQQRIFAANLENLRAKVGSAFLPSITGAMQAVNGLFNSGAAIAAIGRITDGISALGQAVQPFFDAVANFRGDFAPIIQAGADVTKNLMEGLAQAAPGFIKMSLGLLKSFVAAIIPALPSIMQTGAEILLSMLSGLLEAAPTLLDAGLKVIIYLIQGISSALPGLGKTVGQVLPQIIQVLIDNLPLLLMAAGQLILALGQALAASIVEYWPRIISIARKLVKQLGDSMGQFFGGLAQSAGTWLGQVTAGLLQGLATLAGQVGAAVGQWFQSVLATLQQWGQSLWQAVSGAFQQVANIMGTIGLVILGINAMILDGILSLFGTSISQIVAGVQAGWNQMVYTVQTTMTNILTAAKSAWDNVSKTVSDVTGKVIGTLKGWGSQIASAASEAWNRVVEGVKGALGQMQTAIDGALAPITGAIGNIWTAAVNTVSGFIQQFFDLGANIIDGLVRGIMSAGDALGAAIQSVIDAAIAKAKALLGIASPSKVFMGIGVNMGQGLGIGLVNSINDVAASLPGALGGLSLAMSNAGSGAAYGSNTRNYSDNSTTYYGPVYNVNSGAQAAVVKAKRF